MEGTPIPEVEKEAQKFNAEKSGEGAWGPKLFGRKEEEAAPEKAQESWEEKLFRGRKEERESNAAEDEKRRVEDEERVREAEAKKGAEQEKVIRVLHFNLNFPNSSEKQEVMIDRNASKVGSDVVLNFDRMPEPGKLLYLELSGNAKPIYRVEKRENPEENTSYIRIIDDSELKANGLSRESIEKETELAEDMRGYLTSEALGKLNLSRPEAEAEPLRMAA